MQVHRTVVEHVPSNLIDLSAYLWANTRRSDEAEVCWNWTGQARHNKGYGRIPLGDGGHIRANRLAWILAAGPIPRGLQSLHTCDNTACVRNDDVGVYEVDGIFYERRGHLWLGTHAANMADKAMKGRTYRGGNKASYLRGERVPLAKLKEADVREIRRLLAQGSTHRGIAAQFGVSKGPITQIARGVTWRHVV